MQLKAHYFRLTWSPSDGKRTIVTRYAGPMTRAQIRKAFPFNPKRLTIETIRNRNEISEMTFAAMST